MTVANYIASHVSISEKQISETIHLLDDACTIPFIARYRKEKTGNLDEIQIALIAKFKAIFTEISQRKNTILKAITEQNALSSELENKILSTWDEVELEDLYLPFKRKKKTKAAIAREKGLEPLAKILLKQDEIYDLQAMVQKYALPNHESFDKTLEGAQHIMAEMISERENIRKQIRRLYKLEGIVQTKVVKAKENEEEALKFQQFFKFSEPIKRMASHRLLAILRGENQGILKISFDVPKDSIFELMERYVLKSKQKEIQKIIISSIEDAYSRLISPAIFNEVMKEAKLKADENSIKVFSSNLNQLLLEAPLGEKRILAIDPGYRSGCKIVCLDEKGDLLHNETLFPHAPQNQKIEAGKKIKSLVNAYQIEAISIGNGTASRETENWIQKIPFEKPLKVFVVNEAGASIYSASKIARDEFPNYDVTVRGAVSIGRRLADPMAELVKIEPKSIGVGQYQHDVDQTLLKTELDQTVMLCVNKIGVNLNTASKYLLTYVSGIGEKMAENIVDYRMKNGVFYTREDLKNVPRLGTKVFQQASAFLRISNGNNPLDNSSVHPEAYKLVKKMAKDLGVEISELIGNEKLISELIADNYTDQEFGLPTVQDVLNELKKPGVDPRNKAIIVKFDPNIKKIEDLKVGMVLNGIVNNITNFGCFVDIGIKQSGLIHISQLAKEFISDIHSVVQLNQIVEVRVLEVDYTKNRIQLAKNA